MPTGSEVPQRLRLLPSRLLNEAARRGNRLVGARLAEAGLGRHHFAILVSLDEQGPGSQVSIGARLGIDPSDMTAVVGELEQAGYVARERDASDRRRNVVRLTPAGARALAQLAAAVEDAQADLLAPLSDRERRTLVELLARVST